MAPHHVLLVLIPAWNDDVLRRYSAPDAVGRCSELVGVATHWWQGTAAESVEYYFPVRFALREFGQRAAFGSAPVGQERAFCLQVALREGAPHLAEGQSFLEQRELLERMPFHSPHVMVSMPTPVAQLLLLPFRPVSEPLCV